jgi:hypothetical protein
MTEYAACALLPGLRRRIAKAGPAIDLRVVPIDGANVPDRLDAGEIDLACGAFAGLAPRFATGTVGEDRYAVAFGRRRGPLALAEYLEASHVLVPVEGALPNPADEEIAHRHPRRRIALTLAQAAALPAVLAGSDACALVPRRLGEALGVTALVEPPFATPRIRLAQAWHRRRDADPPLAWLRGLVGEAPAA